MKSRLDKIIIKLLYATLFLAVSCDIADDNTTREMAVIDGWINSDGHPVVLFTTTISPGSHTPINEHIINWGRVTIDDGDREIVMTGGPDGRFFPPYRYYTLDMTGTPGKEYTITAEWKEMKVKATARMLAPTPIDSFKVEKIDGNDSLRAATLYFTAPNDCPAYYYIAIETDHSSRPLPCSLGCIRVDNPGEQVTAPVMRPKVRLDSLTYIPQLQVGDTIALSLCRVEKEIFDFWKAYDNAVVFGASQFAGTSTSLPGNIEGGYGVWSPQATSTIVRIIK